MFLLNYKDNIAQARYLIPAAPSAKYELLQDRYEGSLGYKLNENSHQLAVEPSGSIVSMFNDDKAQELKYILLMLSVCMILLTVVLYTVLFYLMIEVRHTIFTLLVMRYCSYTKKTLTINNKRLGYQQYFCVPIVMHALSLLNTYRK